MKDPIHIDNKHYPIIIAILSKNLPSHTHVWVFGSRANRVPKKYSDLDLAIDAGSALPYATIVELKHAFDESVLPYKVDLVDWYLLDTSFQKRIQDDRIYQLPLNPSSD